MNLACAIEKQAVGQFHDVCFVEDGDGFAMSPGGVSEGIASDARAG